jgi:DNA-binding NarL/FixJ family response regulator
MDVKSSILTMIMSNLSDDKTISEGMNLGASGYFTKSQFNPDDVVTTVRSLLR